MHTKTKRPPIIARYFLELLSLTFAVVLFTGQPLYAECKISIKLEGILTVDSCAGEEGCIDAAKAEFDYSVSAKGDPDVYTVSVHASPWHLYNIDWRILTAEDLAEWLKPHLKDGRKRIELIASWSGVAPDPSGKSLAQKLSDSLGGFPVIGKDGFIWLAKDGSIRTTRQAFTRKLIKRPYGVHPGDEVMVSLVAGWPIDFEEDYIKKKDAYGIMRVGVAWDIFMLCPERALQSFEAAAKLSNPIAAYNAAFIRLERDKEGDLEAATALLLKAVALGDKKAKELLQKLSPKSLEQHADQSPSPIEGLSSP